MKMIHSILKTPDGVPNRVAESFGRECEILSTLHHPNIVQFVGVSKDRWIFMEYLHASLMDYIDNGIRTKRRLRRLSLQQKLKILYNVALGLQYLHERDKPILHRDLTARNVLLTKDLRAKIGDLGQAIVKQHNYEQYMSQAPGALCYMPPEVLKHNPKYDQSIDIFSFGVLILHTISELLPVPEHDVQILNNHSGIVIGTRTEIERRPSCVEKLKTMPQLTSLVEQCMHNSAKHRPPVMVIIGRLALAISDEKGSTDNILAVSYSNKELDQINCNLKITLSDTSQNSKLCVIVRPPITIGFTGTYKGTVPFRQIKVSSPRDIAIAKDGRVYVCDYNGRVGVFAYYPTSGIASAIIESARKTESKRKSEKKCWYPQGVAVDDCGNVYLSDTHNHRVLKYSTEISDILGCVGEMLNKGFGPNQFDHPSGIAINGELMYVCDTENHRVQILNSCYLHVIGEFCNDDMRPVDIAIDKEEKLVYILDCTNKNIHVCQEGTGALKLLHTIDLTEPRYLKLQQPVGICVDAKRFIYITDEQKHGVLILDAAANFKMFFGSRGYREGEFYRPTGIDVDSHGNVYVCDSGNGRVQIFS